MQATNSWEKLADTLKKIEGAYAPATIRAYREDFVQFIAFCEAANTSALPAASEVVATFVQQISETGLSSSYIRRKVAAISAIHRFTRHSDPTKDPDVKLEMRRMNRKLGRFSRQACGITAPWLRKMLAMTDDSLRGLRNRALLLVAYEGLLRRSELVSLQVDDLVIDETGDRARIRLRRSKTDQTAQGRWLVFTPATSQALKAWVDQSGIKDGPVFRGISRAGIMSEGPLCVEMVNRIYKRLAKRAGLNSATPVPVSGHSMRIGAAQDLLTSGADLGRIMAAGRWSKTDTVMRYVEQVQGAFIDLPSVMAQRPNSHSV